VISSTTIDGYLKGTTVNFTPEIPAGWEASDPSQLPSEITINNGITQIKIKRIKQNVDPNQPSHPDQPNNPVDPGHPGKPGNGGQNNGNQSNSSQSDQFNGAQNKIDLANVSQTTNNATHQRRLPQTGNTTAEKSGAAILLSIALTLLGLAGRRKRHE
jgi:LPXTG-motif cell wall-anchored protein